MIHQDTCMIIAAFVAIVSIPVLLVSCAPTDGRRPNGNAVNDNASDALNQDNTAADGTSNENDNPNDNEALDNHEPDSPNGNFNANDSVDGNPDIPDGDPGSHNEPDDSVNGSYIIVDTGQGICFDDTSPITCPSQPGAFFGQDGQIDGNQPSYTLNGDGLTIKDNVTGLTWTQSADLNDDGDIDVDDKLTFEEASTYSNTLNAANFGGFNDWRLPSMKELYSLMDFRGTDPPPDGTSAAGMTPFIDTNYFDFGYGDTDAGERIIDAQFWSNNAYVATVFEDQSAAFGLNFADGRIKGYPSSSQGAIIKLNYVYFVRGNTTYGINDFVDNGNGTITDRATGLMWMQNDSGEGMNWEDALAFAQERNAEAHLGYNDWRLPNAKAMQSILDYSRSPDTTGSAAIDPIFNVTQIVNEAGDADYPFFWTSTTHIRGDSSGDSGVYIAFGRGLGSMDQANVIDVHGAGCQRSDPKDGNESEFPRWGFGPQGDVQRVFNYVRLVRDAG